MPERAYLVSPEQGDGLAGRRLIHRYGPNVHILSDPWALSVLARLSHPDVRPPIFHDLLRACYERLLHGVCEQLQLIDATTRTRMTAAEGVPFVGTVYDPHQNVVVVDIARAGMIPSHILQMALLRFLDPDAVRIDHIYMQRVSGPDGGVIGVETSGSKIGGPVGGATVLIPDPMAATGSSITHVADMYREKLDGRPRKIVMCHLMVTPEYLRAITTRFPDVHIYALRLDRGMSPPDVLESIPGTHWERERGLNANGYIVPGAGGLGEIINNAFV